MNHIKILDLREHKGRVFFTTDLHGCYDLLHEKLKEVSFDSTKDILVVGGDMCDRGPDSKYVLDYLNEPWLYCVRANHEQMFIEAYEGDFNNHMAGMLVMNGGYWVVDCEQTLIDAIYQSFVSLPLGIELVLPNEVVGVVHAQCPYNNWDGFKKMSGSELSLNGEATAQWARTNYDKKLSVEIKGVDRLLVGHTPTQNGDIEIMGNTWYCDAGTFFRDKINFIQLM